MDTLNAKKEEGEKVSGFELALELEAGLGVVEVVGEEDAEAGVGFSLTGRSM